MRAILQNTFGGPEVLTVDEAPRPQPMATEVLVRVKAIGLNPIETRVREGEFSEVEELPIITGWDISGVVEETATGRLSVGDEVLGMPLFPRPAHAYAEFVSAPALHLARKPAGLSHPEAAALPCAGLTAWQGLVVLARVRPGDRVLVHAGGGGVGHMAIQIAKAFGAHVITTASPSKRAFVTELGADEVVDYTTTDFSQALDGIDIVLDTLGGAAAEQSLQVLRPGGHFVTAVADDDLALAARFRAAGMRFDGIAVDPDPAGLDGLVSLVERGALRVHVEETFAFEQIGDAHRRLEGGHVQGKLVLTPEHV